jgi:hypothetical protein
MKPYLRDALQSVLAQTRLDIQIIVVDSGQWHRKDNPRAVGVAEVYDDFHDHPLVEWYSTGENADLRSHTCPIGWATNQVIRAGLVRGRYVCTFYDDDVYDPRYMEVMAGYLDEHPDVRAVWCSQKRDQLYLDGTTRTVGFIHAYGPKKGAQFDQLVDGTQVMFRRELLDEIGDPWLPEDGDESICRHSDGIFLDKIGLAAGVVSNIPDILVTHRFTPISAYSPMR